MSAFDRLRGVLLDPERARLESLEKSREDLSKDLPELVRAAQAARPEALAESLATPVADALGGAVKARRQQLVDALFPVIMPAIRRAIAEYLRSVSQDLNRVFESSLTLKGLKWRLEARRLGVPYAAVALRHTLLYQVDHLFLIQRDSGLILDRESAPGLNELDADAVGGMLTAIGDFVRDSVGAGSDELSSATVGEHLVWVLSGPKANLAAWIRGVPPESLKQELTDRLERVHAEYGEQLGLGPEALGNLQGLKDALTPADLKAVKEETADDSSMGPLMWSALGVVLVLAALLIGAWRWSVRLDAVQARLDATPGIEVITMDSWPWWSVDVHVLRDPAAPEVAGIVKTALPDHVALVIREQPIVSGEPAMAWSRVKRAWSIPDSAVASFDDQRVVLSGTLAPDLLERLRDPEIPLAIGAAIDSTNVRPDWQAALATLGPWPEELTVAADGKLVGAAPIEWLGDLFGLLDQRQWQDDLDVSAIEPMADTTLRDWNAALAEHPVVFAEGSSDNADISAGLSATLATTIRHAAFRSPRLGIRCIGLSDPSGTESDNRVLERARAEWACSRLRSSVPAAIPIRSLAAPAGERATLRQRVALVQVELIESP